MVKVDLELSLVISQGPGDLEIPNDAQTSGSFSGFVMGIGTSSIFSIGKSDFWWLMMVNDG